MRLIIVTTFVLLSLCEQMEYKSSSKRNFYKNGQIAGSCTTGGDSAASTQPITAALTIPPTNQSHRDSFPMNIYTVTDGLSAFRSNIFNRPPRRAFHSSQHICRSRTCFSRAAAGATIHHDEFAHTTLLRGTSFKPSSSTEEDPPFASSYQYKLTTRPKSPNVQGYPGVIRAKFFNGGDASFASSHRHKLTPRSKSPDARSCH